MSITLSKKTQVFLSIYCLVRFHRANNNEHRKEIETFDSSSNLEHRKEIETFDSISNLVRLKTEYGRQQMHTINKYKPQLKT